MLYLFPLKKIDYAFSQASVTEPDSEQHLGLSINKDSTKNIRFKPNVKNLVWNVTTLRLVSIIIIWKDFPARITERPLWFNWNINYNSNIYLSLLILDTFYIEVPNCDILNTLPYYQVFGVSYRPYGHWELQFWYPLAPFRGK